MTSTITQDRVLTVKDAAALMRVSPSHIREQARVGGIPGRKCGKRWLFSEQKLMAFVRGEDGSQTKG